MTPAAPDDGEGLLAAALEDHPVPTLIVEAGGRVIFVNAAARGAGWGTSWAALWEDQERAAQALEAALAGEEAGFEDGRAGAGGRRVARLRPLAGRRGLALCTLEAGPGSTAAEEQALLVAREMNHRIRNLLTTVLAVARSTGRRAASLEGFLGAFAARLESMVRTHDLLSRGAPDAAVPLRDLVAAELAPFADGTAGRVRLEGPPSQVPAGAVLPLGMALHELASNAARHGALSRPEGQVSVAWREDGPPDARRLALAWAEEGGPAVEPPRREGFGSQILGAVLPQQVGGAVRREFRPGGVAVEIELPL